MATEFRRFEFSPDVKAGSDLRSFQFAPVRIFAGGVLPGTEDVGSGAAFVLMNRPNSGQACDLAGIGNVCKARVGSGGSTRNAFMTIAGSSWFMAGSFGHEFRTGVALTATASGNLFSLYVAW